MGLVAAIISVKDRKIFITICPTRGVWFEMLVRGKQVWSVIVRMRVFGLFLISLHKLLEATEEYFVSTKI